MAYVFLKSTMLQLNDIVHLLETYDNPIDCNDKYKLKEAINTITKIMNEVMK